MKNMRRKDREITTQEALDLLESAEYGILSTVGEDGQPYGVPLSYVNKNNWIYFHCAVSGQKLDNIKSSAKVSFCVVGQTKILQDQFSTEYESTVVYGVATEVTDTERHNAMVWLLEKYCPDFITEGERYIEQHDKATKIFKIEIKHISGKARK